MTEEAVSVGSASPDWFARGVVALEKLAKEAHALVATITELKAAVDGLVAAEATVSADTVTLSTGFQDLVAAVDGLIAAIGKAKGLSAEDQASVDAAAQEVANSSADLAKEATALTDDVAAASAEAAKARGATPPPPPPPPPPPVPPAGP